MKALLVQDLWVKRGKNIVLKGVSLEADERSILVVLGPNAAGKTTLLDAIAGIVIPFRGLIEIMGRIVYSSNNPKVFVPPEKRKVALVPQEYALFPHMSVYENIAFGLRAKKLSREQIRAKVMHVAEILGITSILDKRPDQLSGGQQQRVALARALAVEPDLLLLDEPFSAMDAPTRERMRSELKRLLKELGITTVMVTHSFADAWALGDVIVVLKDGKKIAGAHPRELIEKPLNHGVAEFLGYIVLKGRVEHVEHNVVILEAPGLLALRVQQVNTSLFKPGSCVLIAFRPDDVVLSKKPLSDVNTFTAKIEEVSFTRYGVRLIIDVGSLKLSVEAPRGPLTVLVGAKLSPGDKVFVHIPPNIINITPCQTD